MIDPTDSRLLAAVQRRADITAQELAEVLNLSPSQAARRRARLEAEGVILGYSARLDAGKLGLTVQALSLIHI